MNNFREIMKYLENRNNLVIIRFLRLGLYFSICIVLTGCCLFKETVKGPNPIDYVIQVHWELVPETVQCPIMGSPTNSCLIPLQLVFTWQGGFVDYKGVSCCLDCERYVPACKLGLKTVEFATGNLPLSPRVRIPGHKPRPGMIIWTREGGIHDNVNRDMCDEFQNSDFEGENLQDLERFLRQLTLKYGQSNDLDPNSNNPRDICIKISTANPPVRTDPNGNTGPVGGEINCDSGALARARNCKYQITLYIISFYGTCKKAPYNTVAHEFKHILQSIELGLPIGDCDEIYDNSQYEQLEQEANDWANSIISDCTDCQ